MERFRFALLMLALTEAGLPVEAAFSDAGKFPAFDRAFVCRSIGTENTLLFVVRVLVQLQLEDEASLVA